MYIFMTGWVNKGIGAVIAALAAHGVQVHARRCTTFKKNGSCRAISTARLEHIAVLPPTAYQRGSLPRPFIPEGNGTFILGPASHLDAFSAYPYRT